MTRLARAGWGDLAANDMKGVRATLRALVDVLPYQSGQDFTTVPQIADASGYTPTWTRHALRILRDLGVVRWTPGGIDAAGVPVPSFVRLVKTALVQLVHAARDVHALILSARRAETRARLDEARSKIRPVKRRGWSGQGNSLHAPAVSTGSTPARPLENRFIPTASDEIECDHGLPRRRDGRGEYECPMCRRAEHNELGRRTAAEDAGQAVVA